MGFEVLLRSITQSSGELCLQTMHMTMAMTNFVTFSVRSLMRVSRLITPTKLEKNHHIFCAYRVRSEKRIVSVQISQAVLV